MSSDAEAEGEDRTIQSLEIGLDIVETLEDLNGATLTELADHLEMPKSNVYFYLHTLESRGYLIRDDYTYWPSMKFLELGERQKENRVQVYIHGQSVAEELADRTGEVVWLMIEEHGFGRYVFKATGADGVETGSYPMGSTIPLTVTGGGKAILAMMSEERRTAILEEHGLPEILPDSITDREALEAELDRVREEGVGRDDEEAAPGIRTVGAPVLGVDGDPLGAISVSGPVSRITGDIFETKYPELLVEASNIIEISARGEDLMPEAAIE